MKSAWEVFLLFLIPIGGGIPAGVVLAQAKGLAWPLMMALYLASDIVLAFLFEPFLWLVAWSGKRFAVIARTADVFKKAMNQSVSKYGVSPGPFSLVMISFGVDPMTGRTAAKAAGHPFVSGWALAITGDMIFFTVIMASTLWLNNLLGDGTWTAVIIMLAMIAVPAIIRRVRSRF